MNTKCGRSRRIGDDRQHCICIGTGQSEDGYAVQRSACRHDTFVTEQARRRLEADDVVDAGGAAFELIYECYQYLIVHIIEATFVYVEGFEAMLYYAAVYNAVAEHLGEVAHAAEEAVGNTRCAAAAAGYFAA